MEKKGGEDDSWLGLDWKEPKPLLEEDQARGQGTQKEKGKSEDKGRDPKKQGKPLRKDLFIEQTKITHCANVRKFS